mgnify:CR=1 FL=1
MGTACAASYDQLVLDEAAADAPAGALARLTPRELEVLRLVSAGMTNAEAARRLELSVHAVKFHLASIYSRLGVANRTEAAVTYLRLAPDEAGARPGSAP